MSDIPDVSSFITKNVNDLIYYTLKTNTGSLIDLEINQTTYVVTLSLKDQDGNVISSDNIDLPLENVVVSGSYDSVNEKIVLTLQSGDTVDIPVGALVAGLQTEITSSNKLASDLVDDSNSGHKFVTTSEKQTWNGKYEKPSGGIPKADLSNDVKNSLDKADTAIQEHQSLADYVKNTDYATEGKGGVIKTNTQYIATSTTPSGTLQADTRTFAQYQNAGNNMFIGKGTLENVIAGKELINKTTLETSQQVQDERTQRILDQLETVTPTKSSNITIEDGADLPLNRFILEGKTEQDSTTGKNLIPRATNVSKSGTVSHTVTFTLNDDGTIKANGTADGGISLNLVNEWVLLPAGTYTFSDSIASGENGTTFFLYADVHHSDDRSWDDYNFSTANTTTGQTQTIPEDFKFRTRIVVREGVSLSNVVFKPMLEKGSSKTDYEPYTGTPSPNPSYPQEIRNVEGKNLENSDNYTPGFTNSLGEIIRNSGTSSFSNQNGTITFTTDADWRGILGDYIKVKPNTKYKFSYDKVTTGATYFHFYNIYDENKNFIERHPSSSDYITTPANTKYIIMMIGLNEANSTGIVSNLQLEEGTEATPYAPYNTIQIKKCNKNLANINLLYGNTTYYSINSNNEVTVIGADARGFQNLDGTTWGQYLPSGTYTMSFNANNHGSLQVYQKDVGNVAVNIPLTNGYATFTMETGGIVGIKFTGLSDYLPYNAGHIQIEKASSKTDYIPHQEKTYNFPLSSGQKLYEGSKIQADGIHNAHKQIVLDGSENWAIYNNNIYLYIPDFILSEGYNDYMPTNFISEYFTRNSLTNALANPNANYMIQNVWGERNRQRGVAVEVSDTFTDLQTFKTWLSTHNSILEYELATEEIIPFTPEQKAVYDEIMSDGTYEGVTHYTAEASINPDIDMTYYKDLQIELSDFVKDTDYATSSKGGTIKVNGYGLQVSNGTLIGLGRTYAEYNNAANQLLISKQTLENVIAGKELVNQTTLNNKVKNENSTTAGDTYDVRYINSMIGNIETLLGGI